MKTIGERIINMRELRDMKQKDLAEKIDVTKATMSKYESNKNFPNADILRKIALTLGTSTDYLVGLTDNIHPYRKEEHTDFLMEGLTETVSKLNKANKIRIIERAQTLLEQQTEQK